ncbi:hypothetical protein FB45DRAFT_872569 [Roridomyces roridus]|uniref:Zn(2)-C6 fungal-type domain-containing protein n=1 Tax=Roridomyces roridus TaxID=1738132 RepID=A0AAD7BCX5_9AGAR|nr:hypothetical protein FB45DRAFT_872569 [Roridomyces roridus]
MSDSDSSSTLSLSPGILPPPFPIQRKRAHMACSNCRKRKVKCSNINNEGGGHEPCERCLKRRLECEYVAVADPLPPRSKTYGHGSWTRNHSTQPPSESPAFHASGMRPQDYPDPYLWDSAFGGDGFGQGLIQFTPPRTNTTTSAHPRPLPTAQYPMEYPESGFLQPGMGLPANYTPGLRTAYTSSNDNHIKPEPGVELGLSWEQGGAFTHRGTLNEAHSSGPTSEGVVGYFYVYIVCTAENVISGRGSGGRSIAVIFVLVPSDSARNGWAAEAQRDLFEGLNREHQEERDSDDSETSVVLTTKVAAFANVCNPGRWISSLRQQSRGRGFSTGVQW